MNDVKSQICAINLIGYDNELLNPTRMPIIFYWNGETSITDDIKADESFMNYIYKTLFSLKHYGYAYISICTYEIIENNEYENLDRHEFVMEDDFSLSDYNDGAMNILHEIMRDMYFKAFESSLVDESDKAAAIRTYIKELFNKYKERISSKTIVNYVRNASIQHKINEKNTEVLVEMIQLFLTTI